MPEAIRLIEQAAPALPSVKVPLTEAYGRTLAEDLRSQVDHPSADNSALDGFACRAADTRSASRAAPVTLKLVGEVSAGGQFSGTLGAGEAVGIYTGAPVPAGADAIIRVEDTEMDGSRVRLFAPASAGDVRRRGHDLRAGEVYLRWGRRLDAAAVGVAAAMGHAEVPVARQPRVALLTTGDEVLRPGEALRPGQVYDANSYSVTGLLRAAGAEAVLLPHVQDDLDLLEQALAGVGDVDLLLTSGGVSMGRYDFVRDLLFERGEVLFWKVAMRPAGPVLFGRWQGLPVLGLPGNPVSSMVAFLVLAKAFLNRALGSSEPCPYHRRRPAVAGEALPGAGFKEAFLRVRWGAAGQVHLSGNQGSSVLTSMLHADALALIPPHTAYAAGEALEVIPLGPYLR